MPINITMPALSPTMEEGNLAKWLVKEGDHVAAGDVIAEIETDKATMEVEAVDEGTVAKIVVPAGTEGVKVNSLIAVLAGDGEDVAEAAKSAGNGEAPARAAAPVSSSPHPEPAEGRGEGSKETSAAASHQTRTAGGRRARRCHARAEIHAGTGRARRAHLLFAACPPDRERSRRRHRRDRGFRPAWPRCPARCRGGDRRWHGEGCSRRAGSGIGNETRRARPR